MKNQWLAFVIVAVISALAGVAIAGPPNNVAADPTIIVPDSTIPVTTVPTTTAPATTVAAPATTTTTTTEAPATTTTVVDPEIDPAVLGVASVNGAGKAGLATQVRDELIDADYAAARATDGTTLVDDSIVYFYPSFEREAAGVAETLGLEAANIEPIDEAPAYSDLEGDQVMVYLGRDQT
jgi:hypothetical protein